MKKAILEALKAKFVGVSEAILNRIADKLAKTVTTAEQVAPAVEGVTFQQVLESYGDSRATEAQQTAVSNYEKKHGLKDGQKVEDGGGTTTTTVVTKPAEGGDLAAQIAAAVQAAVKPLTDEIATLKAGKVTETRRQRLNTTIEKLPENLRKAYGRTPVESLSDDEFETLLSEIGTEVEGIVSDTTAKGAVFGRPVVNGTGKQNQQSGAVKEATDEEAAAVVDKLNI